MKNFVVLDANRKVVEVASLRVNLKRGGDPGVTVADTTHVPWIGDTLTTEGVLIPSADSESERGKEQAENSRKEKLEQDHIKALDKIATAAGLSKDEKDALKEKERANVKKIK